MSKYFEVIYSHSVPAESAAHAILDVARRIRDPRWDDTLIWSAAEFASALHGENPRSDEQRMTLTEAEARTASELIPEAARALLLRLGPMNRGLPEAQELLRLLELTGRLEHDALRREEGGEG